MKISFGNSPDISHLTVILGVQMVFTLVVLSLLSTTATAQNDVIASTPQVTRAVKFDVSPPLSSMRPKLTPKDKDSDDDKGPGGPVGDTRHDPDPVLQSTIGMGFFSTPGAMPPTIANFAGMNGPGGTPPDPVGDIGLTHYVQMVNAKFQVFSRAGVSVYGPANINTIFTGFGGACETENAGDPVVLYDQLADRWLLSQFSDSTAPFFNCVAVSTTGNPTGTYYRYAFSAPSFPDYPKYGMWPNGYYLNTRESGGGVLGIYALERTEMIAGNPAARSVRFTVPETGSGPNGLLPADFDGTTLPPAGSPEYFVGSSDNGTGAAADALQLYKFNVDWVTPANSTFTGPTSLPSASFDTIFPCAPTSRECIPQPGSTVKIDILSYRQRPTYRLAYRNFGDHQSLVTLQSVEASTGIAGMRWWEIRSPDLNPVIYQEGTYGPGATDGIHRWMGSIAMDRQGNMGLGYSVSNGNAVGSGEVYPGIRFTGRLAADPLGTMPQGEGTIVNGGGVQTSTAFRWGDYTSMNVDPIDDCTFWYTTEYYAATSATTYATRVASFKFPGCVAVSRRVPSDFDGDGKTDAAIYRSANNSWYLLRTTAGFAAYQFGAANDILTPADYTGDGKADVAVFRPSSGTWYVLRSEDTTFFAAGFGTAGDIPAPGDYDGDGRADLVVYRPGAQSYWYLQQSTAGFAVVPFGTTGDVPAAGDYDGDGKNDVSVYRPSLGQWFRFNSRDGSFYGVQFGAPGDKIVQADYTGDGKTDNAVFRPSTNIWYILRSEQPTYYGAAFGAAGDIPSPGDYDGDGKADLAVWRPGAQGIFYIQETTSGFAAIPWGFTGDRPTANAYVY